MVYTEDGSAIIIISLFIKNGIDSQFKMAAILFVTMETGVWQNKFNIFFIQ